MFIGPVAGNAQTLESQGVCHAKPVNYDALSLPFNDKSGVEALVALLSGTAVEGPPVPCSSCPERTVEIVFKMFIMRNSAELIISNPGPAKEMAYNRL